MPMNEKHGGPLGDNRLKRSLGGAGERGGRMRAGSPPSEERSSCGRMLRGRDPGGDPSSSEALPLHSRSTTVPGRLRCASAPSRRPWLREPQTPVQGKASCVLAPPGRPLHAESWMRAGSPPSEERRPGGRMLRGRDPGGDPSSSEALPLHSRSTAVPGRLRCASAPSRRPWLREPQTPVQGKASCVLAPPGRSVPAPDRPVAGRASPEARTGARPWERTTKGGPPSGDRAGTRRPRCAVRDE